MKSQRETDEFLPLATDIITRRIGLCLVAVFVLSWLPGCASQRAQPGKITLQEAMKALGESLTALHESRKDKPVTGLVPSEVTAVFNISASQTDTNKLYVEAGANVAEALNITKIGGEATASFTGTRGNSVTVKLTNILYAPKDIVLTTKTPEQIIEMVKKLRGGNIEVYFAPQ